MIPLRDLNRSRTVPFITVALIVSNALVFLYELSLGRRVLTQFLYIYGVVPAFLLNSAHWESVGAVEALLPLLTSMFLHGGWLHFLGNMLYLWVFGDNIEDRLGHLRYLGFYLVSGLAASLLHILTNPSSQLPTVGASGAIAGVLGAYLVLFPGARILTLVPVLFFVQLVELPALIFLGFWFVMQFFSGAISLSAAGADGGGTAWWAHIGGFVAGMAMILKFRNRNRPRVIYY
ncbi:MAG: rhomboid family intramembrane serine protease [Acidobacteriota bacterium]